MDQLPTAQTYSFSTNNHPTILTSSTHLRSTHIADLQSVPISSKLNKSSSYGCVQHQSSSRSIAAAGGVFANVYAIGARKNGLRLLVPPYNLKQNLKDKFCFHLGIHLPKFKT